MKKFWCLFLIALFVLGCSAQPDERIPVLPEETAASAEATVRAETPDTVEAATPAPAITPTPAQEPTQSPTLSPEEKLSAYIEGMTVEEKIGQLCMFGFSGTKEISREFKKILRDYSIGSVILYGQNVSRTNSDGGFKQCRGLTDSIRAANESEIPLLISTDVEGGKVTRFHWNKSLLSADTLGSKNDPERAHDQFQYIAQGLADAGINVDLAPCLDTAKDPDQTFLGRRIISSDADVVSRIGTACIAGLHDGGCLSVVKHFPGHGATTKDSHESTPEVMKTLKELSLYELVPFRDALETADGVMIAHILYPEIDKTRIASQSGVFITDILRNEMGFSGIVMSDDFRMAGLRKQTSLKNGAVQFILAGGDLILCGANHSYQRQILDGLYEAVANGTISEQRLNESVYRILTAKMRVTGWNPF